MFWKEPTWLVQGLWVQLSWCVCWDSVLRDKDLQMSQMRMHSTQEPIHLKRCWNFWKQSTVDVWIEASIECKSKHNPDVPGWSEYTSCCGHGATMQSESLCCFRIWVTKLGISRQIQCHLRRIWTLSVQLEFFWMLETAASMAVAHDSGKSKWQFESDCKRPLALWMRSGKNLQSRSQQGWHAQIMNKCATIFTWHAWNNHVWIWGLVVQGKARSCLPKWLVISVAPHIPNDQQFLKGLKLQRKINRKHMHRWTICNSDSIGLV
jgi:hypothetical protein